MTATRREWEASTHTPLSGCPDRKATTGVPGCAPHPFAANNPDPPPTLRPLDRIGWSLALMVLAQTAVAAAAIATDSHAIGLVSTTAMALCGILLVGAECVQIARGAAR